MTADEADSLVGRIARVLDEVRDDLCGFDAEEMSAAVLPIVADEVRAAKADAILMDGFDMAVADRLADAGYTEYAEDEDGGVTWVSAPLGEVLHIVRICATEYETGDRA